MAVQPHKTNRGGEGGVRKGAGRPKGVRNKKTKAVIAKAEATGIMPLDVMLEAMRRDWEAKRYDEAHLKARDAAPYLHARLKNIEHTHVAFDASQLTDEELALAIKIRARLESDGSAVPGVVG